MGESKTRCMRLEWSRFLPVGSLGYVGPSSVSTVSSVVYAVA